MELNQVTVAVSDMAKAIDFYERLGLRLIVHTHEAYARFEMPGGGATFSLYLSEVAPESETVIYFEVEDVDARYAQLGARGIVFEGEPEDMRWLWREVRLSDPSGNKLCLYHAGRNRRFPPWRRSAG